MRNIFRIFLVLLASISSGCSMFVSDEATPEVKMAVLRVCDEYLRNLAGGMSEQAEAMIAWSDYKPVRDGLSRAEFSQIVKSKKGIWNKEENPLLGLDILETEIVGDSASVELIKKSTSQRIKIKLSWIGRGWVVVSDNIMSEDGVFRAK